MNEIPYIDESKWMCRMVSGCDVMYMMLSLYLSFFLSLSLSIVLKKKVMIILLLCDINIILG